MSTVTPTGTTATIQRVWSQIAPKVLAFLATGLSASVIIHIVGLFGFQLDPGVAGVIATLVGFAAGYFKSDHVLLPAESAPAAAPAAPTADLVSADATE